MMWLGMLAAIVGQVPGVPVEPLTALAGLLAAYVAQVAHWLGAARLGAGGRHAARVAAGAVAAAYAALGVALSGRGCAGPPPARRGPPHRRDSHGGSPPSPRSRPASRWHRGARGRTRLWPAARASSRRPRRRAGRLDPARSGRRRAGAGGRRAGRGRPSRPVERGGRRQPRRRDRHPRPVRSRRRASRSSLLRFPVHRLLYGEPGPDFLRAARAVDVPALRVSEGSEVSSGSLRLEVLWPPGAAPSGRRSRIRTSPRWCCSRAGTRFSMLLTADAEAEAVPLDPGPVDVLKVAHHGSDDAGLGALLDRTVPRLAVISVGAGESLRPPDAGDPRHAGRTRDPDPADGPGRRRDDRRQRSRLARREWIGSGRWSRVCARRRAAATRWRALAVILFILLLVGCFIMIAAATDIAGTTRPVTT